MESFVADNLGLALKDKKILVGVTGSVAAFKVCDVIRFLKLCGAEVRVILSENASKFVTVPTLENLSGSKVSTSLWEEMGTHHIDTARWADLFLVVPASANFLGKLAHGLADDLLTTELLAFDGPVQIVPAMNPSMWKHPAVKENVKQLKKLKYQILGPVIGSTACGEHGEGRMLEPKLVVESVANAFRKKSNGKKVLISLGPTRSAIDPVRFLTNRSSGKMGAAMVWTAYRKGYDVCVVKGYCDVELPDGVEVIEAQTAPKMRDEVLKQWETADIYIGAAAVLDWDIKNPSKQKIKKKEGLSIEFEKNPDILNEVSEKAKDHQFVLGFAAETREPVHNGQKKLRKKQCHAIFVNDVSKDVHGFESPMNAGWWINDEEIFELPEATKAQISESIFKFIEGKKPKSAKLIMHQPMHYGLRRGAKGKTAVSSKENNESKKISKSH